jgi:hypothetical protein
MMKKYILAWATITGLTITSCNTPAQKVEIAQNTVNEAEQNLNEANQAYLADIEKFRKEADDRIALNNKSIAEFNTRMESEKADAKADYKKKIREIEKRNTDLKKKMDDYKAESKDQWDKFKTEFSKDMEELGQAFKNITIKNN